MPNALIRLMSDKDNKSGRAMRAMMTVRKIDIAACEKAAAEG